MLRTSRDIPCQCVSRDDEEEDHEVIVNTCGHQCYIIGGPFISYDPCCPTCSRTSDDDPGGEGIE
jgi:hypothetical protein